jgi:hypothetical protein
MAAEKKDWRELWLQPIATVLSVFIAAAGIYFATKSNNDTERKREGSASALAVEDARRAFQLAAVQIVMSQRTCTLAQARAKTLVMLFPAQLDPVLQPLTRPSLGKDLCKQLKTSAVDYTAFLGNRTLFKPGDLGGYFIPTKSFPIPAQVTPKRKTDSKPKN